MKQQSTVPHVKTSKTITQVERMVACGLDVSQIAYVMQISAVELKANYAEQLEYGQAAVIAKVGASLLRSALRGDTNAAQFFLRARAKWVTPTKIEQDVNMTVEDKRKLMDDIVKLVAKEQVPVEQATQLASATRTGRPN